MTEKWREIVVVMHSNLWCFRELLHGIGAFSNAKATWRVQYCTPQDNIAEIITQHRPEGVLLGSYPWEWPWEPIHAAFEGVSKVINVCRNETPAEASIPVHTTVDVDDFKVGALAADHFLQKKHTNYCYVGYDTRWSQNRFEGFRSRLREAGYEPRYLPDWEPVSVGRGWERAYPKTQLASEIRSLPMPLALMVCNDNRGREILEACKRVGLRVPEDVAILGVDDDPLECQLCHPSLSSVTIPWLQIGYRAAQELDRALDGDPAPDPIRVSPVAIAERRSTDSIAISDADVASVLRYIREHSHVAFSVEDILRAVPAGRRTLEKRFKSILGRTLLDEIRRVRIDRAKDLLAQSDMPVSEVAERSGFSDVTWFSTSFHRLTGTSPLQYRKAFKK